LSTENDILIADDKLIVKNFKIVTFLLQNDNMWQLDCTIHHFPLLLIVAITLLSIERGYFSRNTEMCGYMGFSRKDLLLFLIL
jgi:hypothetical protein